MTEIRYTNNSIKIYCDSCKEYFVKYEIRISVEIFPFHLSCIKYSCAISKRQWGQELIREIEMTYKFLTDYSKIEYNIDLVKWVLKVIWMDLERVSIWSDMHVAFIGEKRWVNLMISNSYRIRYVPLVKLSIVKLCRHLSPHKPG